MVDAIIVILHMAVKHGRVRLQTNLVGEFCSFQPLVAVDLVVADNVAHAVGENFGAAARQGIDARGLELLQRFANGKFGATGEICDFDHGESFEMDLRKALLQAGAEIEEILERQVGMQSANNMKFGDRLGVPGGSGLK